MMAHICIVDLVGAPGKLERLEMAGVDPRKERKLAPFRGVSLPIDEVSAVADVLRTREPLLVPRCSPSLLASTVGPAGHETLATILGACSIIVAPLMVRERAIGAITFLATEAEGPYTNAALSTTCDLAARAALAIDNAQLYERAQRAVLEREKMLSFVSHDLRSPLMGIHLTAETLLRATRVGQERRKGWRALELVRRNTRQMQRMIDDLLDVGSLDSGHLTIRRASHDVRRLFDDVAFMHRPLASDRNHALGFEVIGGATLQVLCDRDRVIRILSNLIANSIKFTPQGGSISVTARAAGEYVRFAVSDTGPGISAALRPRVFERFARTDEGTHPGHGLGLYIAKGLVEAQGGTIWVDDAAVGAGATFSFTLPLAASDVPSDGVNSSGSLLKEPTRRSVI